MLARTPPPHSTAFVQLRSGLCVDLMAPDLFAVGLTDFAVSLARIARFNGHTRGLHPLSVAQHSVEVLGLLPAEAPIALLRAALLHDAHEALMGDIATPVKAALGAAVVGALEARLQSAVAARFHLPCGVFASAEIRHADAVMLSTERRDVMAPAQWPWTRHLPPPRRARVEPWSPAVAEGEFLAAARRLGLR